MLRIIKKSGQSSTPAKMDLDMYKLVDRTMQSLEAAARQVECEKRPVKANNVRREVPDIKSSEVRKNDSMGELPRGVKMNLRADRGRKKDSKKVTAAVGFLSSSQRKL